MVHEGKRSVEEQKKMFFTLDERAKIDTLCYFGKRGLPISNDNRLFIEKMFKKNPEEYEKIQEMASKRCIENMRLYGYA